VVDFLTKAAANKKAKFFSEDYKGIVEEATSKKKVLITTKMQKEAIKRCNCTEAESKHLYPLLEHYYCL